MSGQNIIHHYSKYYKEKKLNKLYPTEFVVRSFLGTYPNLKPNYKSSYKGKKVLDLGCGDGRNIPFLSDLGYQVYGLEINKQIVDFCSNNLKFNNYFAELKVGINSQTNFDSNFFDCIVACHSLYYLNDGEYFEDNLNEINRILKKKGRLVFSIPNSKSYLLKDAEILKENHAIIRSDPLKIRNGTKIKFFDSKEEILSCLSNQFDSLSIGSCENDWWGTNEFCWTIVAYKKE